MLAARVMAAVRHTAIMVEQHSFHAGHILQSHEYNHKSAGPRKAHGLLAPPASTL